MCNTLKLDPANKQQNKTKNAHQQPNDETELETARINITK